MGFLGVYRAVYDYVPQATGELAISDGDLLFILDKHGDDGWWRARKKARAEDEEEPEGLVPTNYVEEAEPLSTAQALFEYTRQTDEELSFHEDAILRIFDTSDPDWILAGLDDEFGFVPANYIDMRDSAESDDDDPLASPPLPSLPARPVSKPEVDSPTASSIAQTLSPPNPATALAGVMQGRAISRSSHAEDPSPPPQPPRQPSAQHHDAQLSDEYEEPAQSPALPSRPRPQSTDDYGTPIPRDDSAPASYRAPGGFHMYNISEMISVVGKRKKMPTTLGINLGTGMILIAPEKASDGPSQEWSADRMTHYSREGKHVFMELVRPSKSIDFHAGAKDTAEEIVASLGEMAGAVRAEGLREVIMAGTKQSQQKGIILYDFMAQGTDEVTVAADDEVIIVDNSKSDEWWQVRRLKNGKEGVVPSSYVEVTGNVAPSSSGQTSKSTIEQNREEEIRLTKEALKASKSSDKAGSGVLLPDRGSSLASRDNTSDGFKQRTRRESGRGETRVGGQSKSKSKPDLAKVRSWTDRLNSYSAEAQFLGLKDGKIHLHKTNGVKIAVPIAKMSFEDLEYVESVTGISLDDERPLADMKKSKSSIKKEISSGASVEKSKRPQYDWFQFFLACDVAVGLCERYAQAFSRESMDESVLPDVNSNILRNLGLREGDIIKVVRYLDSKFGRKGAIDGAGPESSAGGLFSGSGGTLRNNTRKGRPAPAVQTSDVVDAAAFSKNDRSAAKMDKDEIASPRLPDIAPQSSPREQNQADGFDDDAWDVKPSKQHIQTTLGKAKPDIAAPAAVTSMDPPQLTGSMQDLSLLSQPLQPSKPEPPVPKESPKPERPSNTPGIVAQPTGATPSFFSTLPSTQQTPSQDAYGNHVASQALLRQRPTPPVPAGSNALAPPPPQGPSLAPSVGNLATYNSQGIGSQPKGFQGRIAPPGEAMNEIQQTIYQQEYARQMMQHQPMMTGYAQGMSTFPTGNPHQLMQPMMTGQLASSGYSDPRGPQFSPLQVQQTGYQLPYVQPQAQGFGQQQNTVQGSINQFLPQALQPQGTGMNTLQQQQTGIAGFGGQAQNQMQPLKPQQTGPPPPVRFGVSQEATKLAPQATGRRANLSQATPQNPFGF